MPTILPCYVIPKIFLTSTNCPFAQYSFLLDQYDPAYSSLPFSGSISFQSNSRIFLKEGHISSNIKTLIQLSWSAFLHQIFCSLCIRRYATIADGPSSFFFLNHKQSFLLTLIGIRICESQNDMKTPENGK